MATQLSGLKDADYRAMEPGQAIHLVAAVWPGPSCSTLVIEGVHLRAGMPWVRCKDGEGTVHQLNRHAAGVHHPEDCPFHNVIALRRTA